MMLEESVEGYEQLKEALILISPVQVSFESIEGSANGYYSPAEEKNAESSSRINNSNSCIASPESNLFTPFKYIL